MDERPHSQRQCYVEALDGLEETVVATAHLICSVNKYVLTRR